MKITTKSNRLVLGLDYGTTYTGVSFCEIPNANSQEVNPEVIHDWPSVHTKIGTKEKVPSEVAYLDDGTVQWGSNIKPSTKRHMWTKLRLEAAQNGEVAKIVQELYSSTEGDGKQPVDIVSDYLTFVNAHLIQNLDNRYGKELWKTLSTTLVVTVPAVWSDAAKDRTLQAIQKAGFTTANFPRLENTVITTEPEAAAIYTIKTLRGTAHENQLKVGDGFTVFDMGGGTIDLISYKIVELNPIIMEEATVGNGDQCGGSFVDRAFLRWLERRLGTTDFFTIAGCRSEEVPRTSLAKKAAIMLQDFTLEVKSGFSGTETNFLRLPAPLSALDDDEARGICDGEITITAEDMHEMFEFPVRRSYELLMQQWQRARKNKCKIKQVFLVGGFAESPYMYTKLKEFIESNGLKAIKPSYAWSAVVRGAAAKGLEGDSQAVLKRKSRRHYGTGCSEPFKYRHHRESEAYIDVYSGAKFATDQMSYLIKKGQDMHASKETHAKTSIRAKFWPGEARKVTWRLLACNTDEAPQRTTHKSVFRVATLTVDLAKVPQSCFEEHICPLGRKYFSVVSEVHISMQSALEFFVTINGKKYGSLTAKYE